VHPLSLLFARECPRGADGADGTMRSTSARGGGIRLIQSIRGSFLDRSARGRYPIETMNLNIPRSAPRHERVLDKPFKNSRSIYEVFGACLVGQPHDSSKRVIAKQEVYYGTGYLCRPQSRGRVNR